jgi:hypothetical protein
LLARWGVVGCAIYKFKIQNLNAKMISDDDGQWISNDNGQCPLAVSFACLFQHKQAEHFAPFDRACKD